MFTTRSLMWTHLHFNFKYIFTYVMFYKTGVSLLSGAKAIAGGSKTITISICFIVGIALICYFSVYLPEATGLQRARLWVNMYNWPYW